MHAASRHGTPTLTSLPKDGLSELFWSFIRKVAHPVSDRTQPCLTSVKLMELAGPLTPLGSNKHDFEESKHLVLLRNIRHYLIAAPLNFGSPDV